MPIDASIPLQAKNPQIESPMNQLAMMSDAMKIGEMQRGLGVQNELRNLYSQGVDVSTPEGFKRLASVDPASAIKLRRDALEGRRLQAETGLKEFELDTNKINKAINDVANHDTPEAALASIKSSVDKGILAPDKAQALITSMQNIPFRQWQSTQISNLLNAKDRLTLETTRRGQDIQAGTTRRGQDLGRIPVGYRMTPEGTLEAMPGGPTTTNLSSKEIQARESKYPVATQAVNTFEAKTNQLEKDLLTLKNHPGLSSITGIVAGRAPAVTKEGREAQALYDKIVARGGFKELQDMRAASPTGGALGNVSNQEGTQLRQSFAAIDRRQDASDVQSAIDQAVTDLKGSKQRVRDAYEMTYEYKAPKGSKAPPKAPGAAGNTVTTPDGKVFTFPTAEAAAQFRKNANIKD
jgi:hypothetical protein